MAVVATYDIRPLNEAFESTSPRLSLLNNQTINFVERMCQVANTASPRDKIYKVQEIACVR